MATLTNATTITPRKKKLNVDELSIIIRKGIDESIGDMIVTVFVTSATLLYMFLNVHPVFLDTIPGFYIFGMLVQLLIRLVQRFDADYTTTELGNQLIGLEDRIMAKLESILTNMAPY